MNVIDLLWLKSHIDSVWYETAKIFYGHIFYKAFRILLFFSDFIYMT